MYLHYATKYVVEYNGAWDFPYQMDEITNNSDVFFAWF